MAKKRQHNDGLRKVCGCPRRGWAKCPHPWHLNFQHEGQHYRLSLDRVLSPRKVRDKTTAKKEADAIRVAIRDGTFGKAEPAPDSLTLKGLVELYLERYVRVYTAAATQAGYTSQLGALVATSISRGDRTVLLGDLPADAVAAGDIEAALQARQAATRTGSAHGGKVAANRTRTILASCYRWAMDEEQGYVTATPFKRSAGRRNRTRFKEAPRRRRLEDGEEARLLAEAGPRLRALIVAALDTGCRIGELLSLQWAQVSFSRNEIRLVADKTKTRAARTIPLTQRLRAVLEMRRTDPEGDVLPGGAYVFGNAVGEPVKDVFTAWTAARERARITGLHFHDLRREAGSRWLDGGVPLQTIRDWLGHTNITQTSTYLASTATTRQDAMARFEATRATLQDFASPAGNGVPNVPLESETRTENPH